LFNIGVTVATLVCLYCDNISAMYMIANLVQNDHSKHVAVDYYFFWERVAAGDLVVCYIPTMF